MCQKSMRLSRVAAFCFNDKTRNGKENRFPSAKPEAAGTRIHAPFLMLTIWNPQLLFLQSAGWQNTEKEPARTQQNVCLSSNLWKDSSLESKEENENKLNAECFTNFAE